VKGDAGHNNEQFKGRGGGQSAEHDAETSDREEWKKMNDCSSHSTIITPAKKHHFHSSPPLRHHAHPFFAIDNALPKLFVYSTELSREHFELYECMMNSSLEWLRITNKTSSGPRKRRRSDGASPDNKDGHDDGSRRKSRRVTQAKPADPQDWWTWR
jgi:hypothetical protein